MIGLTFVACSSVRATSFLKRVNFARLMDSGFMLRFNFAGATICDDPCCGPEETMDWASAEPFGMHIATSITEYINVVIFTETKEHIKSVL